VKVLKFLPCPLPIDVDIEALFLLLFYPIRLFLFSKLFDVTLVTLLLKSLQEISHTTDILVQAEQEILAL